MIEFLTSMYDLAVAGEKQGIFFWICLYTLLVVGFSAIFQIRVRQWPRTRGELTNVAVEKFGATEWVKSEQDYRASALYRYTVNGEEYIGNRLSPWIIVASHNARFVLQKQLAGIHRYEDGSVDVIFNPAKPDKSYLIRPGMIGLVVTISIAVLPMVFHLLSY